MCLNNTSYKLHATKFQRYAVKTYRLYVRRYRFYPMSPSVHKLLLHAVEIQEHLQFPLGVLSESSGELWHRMRKQIRRDSTRKCSRQATMEDLLHRCLDQSDPVVSEIARDWMAHFRDRKLELPEEAKKLLIISDEDGGSTTSSESDDDDDDDDLDNRRESGNESHHDPKNSSSSDSSDEEISSRPSKIRRTTSNPSNDERANFSQYDDQLDDGNDSDLWVEEENSDDPDYEQDEEEYLYEYNDGD